MRGESSGTGVPGQDESCPPIRPEKRPPAIRGRAIMAERFFLADPPRDGRGLLEADEARHLVRVLRSKVGDEIVVFDGRGGRWPARIARIDRDAVVVDLLEPATADRGPSVPARPSLTLAVALPKGERQKWMVEKLTELGVDRLVPLVTARGVAEATAAAADRLRRVVIEACKQCGRDTLMEVAAASTLDELAAAAPAARLLIADPDGPPLDVATAGEAVVAAVGPEGGFTPDEIAAAGRLGFRPASLARHVLRIETAAIAVAARFADRSP
ncbi:MAG: 16S rRNA (uracil(1498)-N(3))-methyltransferase [Planctomycetia bacterium]|nr:16S rRNA (uracil(1498)-N(3))-methyltransferase [Planctomycetia bacterium]